MDDDKMVMCYRFPFTSQDEATLLGTYSMAPGDRLAYYQTLSALVERNFTLSNYLEAEEVPSILTYESTYQNQDDDGVIHVYGVLNEPVSPILQSIFAHECNALTALDVFLRLAHILRDIHKTPCAPTLRYLDLNDVYLTLNNKILLGGFYYAAAEGLSEPPPFLQDAAAVVPSSVRKGHSDAGTDMQILARIAWNIFSGIPWDSKHTAYSCRIPPAYAPEQLRKVLELGLSADPSTCNTFRKQLMACRKELSKTDFAHSIIPICECHKKEYAFTTIERAVLVKPDSSPTA